MDVGQLGDIQEEVPGKQLAMKAQCSTQTTRPVGRMKAGRERGEGGRGQGKEEGRQEEGRDTNHLLPTTRSLGGFGDTHPTLFTA